MKKLNLGNINAGLNSLKAATDNAAQNGRFELIDTALIDFAAKNSYAADDNEESYKELAANIDEVGLLTPLGVIVNGNRYTLFSGERRFRAITTYLHWTKVPCYVFETKSVRKAQLMLHQANASREYTPQRKLQLYEEYRELLEEMKEAGEIKGGMQEHKDFAERIEEKRQHNFELYNQDDPLLGEKVVKTKRTVPVQDKPSVMKKLEAAKNVNTQKEARIAEAVRQMQAGGRTSNTDKVIQKTPKVKPQKLRR